MEGFADMKEALSVASETPLNSSYQVFKYLMKRGVGLSWDEKLGGDCVYSANILKSMLEDQGYEVRLLQARNSTHAVVLAKSDGKLWLMDPFLMHEQPICLDHVRRVPEGIASPAHPHNKGEKSEIVVIQAGPDEFDVTVRMVYEDLRTMTHINAFRFCLSDIGSGVQEDGSSFYAREKVESTQVRVLRGGEVFSIRHMIHENSLVADRWSIDQDFFALSARVNDPSSATTPEMLIETVLSSIASIIGVSELQICETLFGARDFYLNQDAFVD